MTDTPRVITAPPFTPERAALNFAARLLRADYDDHELRHSHLSATVGDVPAIREALHDLADRLARGAVLPTGTETVEEFGARVYRDGRLIDESDPPVSRELAQARVDWHARKRVAKPGWPGSAELVRRYQHTTPWESVSEAAP